MKTSILAAVLLAASAGVASAGGQAGSLGVGAEYQIASGLFGGAAVAGVPIGGPSVNYDAGAFHVGGYLTIADGDGPDNTTIGLGGRFFYHVHSTAMSDFSVGGTLGFVNFDVGPDDRNTALFLEPGVQIRAFITSNVALSFNAGLVIGAIDASGFAMAGQATGVAGVHYYFF
jgi:hypothetical protein